MGKENLRLLLAPDPEEEPIPVSPRKLADLVRETQELKRELGEARDEKQKQARELHPTFDKG